MPAGLLNNHAFAGFGGGSAQTVRTIAQELHPCFHCYHPEAIWASERFKEHNGLTFCWPCYSFALGLSLAQDFEAKCYLVCSAFMLGLL